MFNSIPCHTTVNRDYTNPMSPDYIDQPDTHETTEFELAVTFEEILAERTTHITDEDVAYYAQEGFDCEEVYKSLAKKMVAEYGEAMIKEFRHLVLKEYRSSALTTAEELIEIYGFDAIDENGWGKDGLSIKFEIETEIEQDHCPW